MVFNCTGLGSRALFGDNDLVPVRGQLEILLPQPEIAIQFKEGLIDAAGDVVDERARRRLQMFLDRFEAWLG